MYQGRYWSEEMFAVVDALVEVAREQSMTPAQAAVAWMLSRDSVTSPIVGASRPDQLQDTVKALDRKLSPEAVAKLDEASRSFL
jgi:aryl-alcohol dehydrogenase-like predicted oxidoreductase